jgi:hypothetical protein
MKRRHLGELLKRALACGIALALASPAAAELIAKAWVLDSGWNSVVALEPATGRRLATLMVKSRPEGLLLSPDGSRLAVLERGPGEHKGERGYKARGRSAATVVDTAAMTILGRIELGAGVEVGRAYFGADRVAFFCPGYEAKDAEERQPREIVVVDLLAGREIGRVALEFGVVPVGMAADGRTLVLIQGLPRTQKPPYPRSRLWFVDLSRPALDASVEAAGWTDAHMDGVWLYLLDRGKADPDARKNKNGSVQVVSIEKRAVVTTIDAGRAPRGLVADAGSKDVLVVSDGPPGRLDSELRVIRGEAVAVSQGVAAQPKLVVRRQGRAFVVGSSAVTVAEIESARVVGTIPLSRAGSRVVFDDDVPQELQVSPDGRRGFLLYDPGYKLLVLDLEPLGLAGVARTGRGSRKLMRGLGQVASAAAFVPTPVGDFAALAGLATLPMTSTPAAAGPLLALREDGRFAYALSVATEDVTVVDGTAPTAVTHLAIGGVRLRALGGGATIATMSADRLVVVDTATQRTVAQVDMPGLRDVAVSRDGRHGLALAPRGVLCLDGVSGRVIAVIKEFVEPTLAVFEAVPAV